MYVQFIIYIWMQFIIEFATAITPIYLVTISLIIILLIYTYV